MTETTAGAGVNAGTHVHHGHHVHHMRQVLLWPLRLMPAIGADQTHQRPWEVLRASPYRKRCT